MITKHKINMDLQMRTVPRIPVVQCDTESRAVEMTMMEGGLPWVPETVDRVLLRYRKSDGTGGSYDTLSDGSSGWHMEGNVLTLFLADQVMTVPGLVEAQAVLLRNDACIATFGFQIVVEADPSLGAVTSENYVNWTAWSQQELEKKLEQAKQSGDFDGGTYVPSVSGQGLLTFHNDRDGAVTEPVDIIALLAQELESGMFLSKSGGTMTGAISMGGNKITNLAAPTASNDSATKAYVDGLMKYQTVLLSSSQWSGGKQTVSLSGVTSSCPVIISPAPVSHRLYGACGVRCTAQGTDTLTFTCDSVPNLPLQLCVAVFR